MTAAAPALPSGLAEPQPYPLRAPDARQLALRTAQTMRTLRRRVVLPLLTRQATRRPVGAVELARPLRRAFRDLGGTYTKLGQLIASVPALLGEEVAAEFRSLLDQGADVPFPWVLDELRRATGDRVRATFDHIDPEPVGRASMAIVHRAVLRDGREVAVKILRPHLEGTIASDLAILGTLLPQIAERVDGARPELVRPVLSGLRQQLCEELDLRNEARVLELVGRQYAAAGLDQVVVPTPYPELTTRRVLFMEYLDGVPVDDLAGIAAHGLEPGPVVGQLVEAFFLTALRDGFFHGDLHAGNLLLLANDRLGVLDWGIVGRFEPDSHRQLVRIVRAALGDDEAWEQVADWAMGLVGEVVLASLPLDEVAVRSMLRVLLAQVFTTPIGQLDLSLLFGGGLQPPPDAPGIDPDSFDRGLLLLGKQLLFYERYARRYLPERCLLDDRAFFADLVGLDLGDR